MKHEDIEEITEKKTALDMSDIWKWVATIAVSATVSFGGFYLTERSRYISKEEVVEMIGHEQDIIKNDMRHYEMSVGELKKVVENNNIIMQGVREELASMRQEIKNIATK